jgi:hypothetical protein
VKKLLIVLILMITPAIALFSETINFDFSLGYATTSISGIDNALQNIPDAPVTIPTPNSGYYFAFDANYVLQNGFMIGPRIEFINTVMNNWGPFTVSTPIPGGDYSVATYSYKYSASLMPMLLGVSYKSAFERTPFFVKGGVYLGYAPGSAYNNITRPGPYMPISPIPPGSINIDTISMSGSGFVGEVLLSFNCAFFGLNIGYRKIYIPQMTYSNTVSDSNLGIYVNKGAVVKDLNNKTMGFDFSGFIFGYSINIGF